MDNICTRNLIFLLISSLSLFSSLLNHLKDKCMSVCICLGRDSMQKRCGERGGKTTTLTYPGVLILDIRVKKTNKVIGEGKTSCTDITQADCERQNDESLVKKLMMM